MLIARCVPGVSSPAIAAVLCILMPRWRAIGVSTVALR
jgi:hypothetical protein